MGVHGAEAGMGEMVPSVCSCMHELCLPQWQSTCKHIDVCARTCVHGSAQGWREAICAQGGDLRCLGPKGKRAADSGQLHDEDANAAGMTGALSI